MEASKLKQCWERYLEQNEPYCNPYLVELVKDTIWHLDLLAGFEDMAKGGEND